MTSQLVNLLKHKRRSIELSSERTVTVTVWRSANGEAIQILAKGVLVERNISEWNISEKEFVESNSSTGESKGAILESNSCQQSRCVPGG